MDTRKKRLNSLFAFSATLGLSLFLTAPVQAACDNPGTANPQLANMETQDTNNIELFTEEITNFISDDLETAQIELETRLTEFDENIRQWLEDWWFDEFRPTLQEMTKQLHTAEADQSRNRGSFFDAQTQAKTQREQQETQMEIHREFRPTEEACQADSIAISLGRADNVSRHVAKALTNNVLPRMGNKTGSGATTAAAGGSSVSTDLGTETERRQLWQEYLTYFCDPQDNAGNSGCPVGSPGLMPNQDLHLGDILWGERKTIDMTNPDNRLLVDAMLRNIINPIQPENLGPQQITTTAGRRTILDRRTGYGRQMAVYNVFSRMIGLRTGGSNATDVNLIRTKAGIDAPNASGDPSYYEVMEAMTRDKFREPEYITKLIKEPENLVREGVNITSFQLQQMNDAYKRLEERTFLRASDFARDLDNSLQNVDSAGVGTF